MLLIRLAKLASNRKGQDLVEYALMAGLVAVGVGASVPTVATSISTIFSQVLTVMNNAAGGQDGGGPAS